MIKYRAYNGCKKGITTVEIASETKSSVVLLNGRRAMKKTDYESYFDTWLEAKNHLLELSTARINKVNANLQHERSAHGMIKSMKDPVS